MIVTSELVETAQKAGYVYVLYRVDLNKCYVGQAITARRPRRHLAPGSYQYDELCGDGLKPIIETLETNLELGDELDCVERAWMRAMLSAKWNLINRTGPDDPVYLTTEWASYAGKLGGAKGGHNLAARRAADPEFDRQWRLNGPTAAIESLWQHRAEDSDFDAHCARRSHDGSFEAAKVRAHKRATDPEWAAREREYARRGGLAGGRNGGLATAKLQRICVECGLGPTTPGGLGFHQSRTGHKGVKIPGQEG